MFAMALDPFGVRPPKLAEPERENQIEMTGLKDRVALVTGAASGIGRAAALLFAAEGAKVILADINDAEGEVTAGKIQDAGGKAYYIRTNVSSAIEAEALVKRAVLSFGRLDYAFNNAGIEGEQANTSDCTEENWVNVMNVNLKGVWLCMKYEIRQMLRQGSGSIVNTSSVAGLAGFEGIAAYSASKHGIIGLTKTAALEYAKSGIRVNAVCPGIIRTPMVERFLKGSKEAEAGFAALEPMGRLGDPKEVAEAAVWLCSGAASFITGEALTVDGGFMAR